LSVSCRNTRRLGITVVAADLPEVWRLWEAINDWWDEIETFIETRVTNAVPRPRTPRLSTSSAPDAATATTGIPRPVSCYAAATGRHAGSARLNQQAITANCG
jgi:hypothetical protein